MIAGMRERSAKRQSFLFLAPGATECFEQRPEGIQFSAEAAPVSCFQSLKRMTITGERLGERSSWPGPQAGTPPSRPTV